MNTSFSPVALREIYAAECREVAYFMRRLYRQKLTTTSGGNISCRLTHGPLAGSVAATPAALDKARTRASQISIVGLDGVNHTADVRVTSELRMHLAIYERCPHVQAVVHAHPATASAFTATGDTIDVELLAESYAILGYPELAPYALTATDELADVVADCATRTAVVMLQNHGITCCGRTLLESFDRLELIENAAQMTLISRQLAGVRRLSPEQRKGLDTLMGR